MITRRVVFADENGRINRVVKVEAEDERSLAVQSERVLRQRGPLDKFVFTGTKDEHALPEVEEAAEERVMEEGVNVKGFQVFQPMTREAKMAQWWGGARLNSVAARMQRESK